MAIWWTIFLFGSLGALAPESALPALLCLSLAQLAPLAYDLLTRRPRILTFALASHFFIFSFRHWQTWIFQPALSVQATEEVKILLVSTIATIFLYELFSVWFGNFVHWKASFKRTGLSPQTRIGLGLALVGLSFLSVNANVFFFVRWVQVAIAAVILSGNRRDGWRLLEEAVLTTAIFFSFVKTGSLWLALNLTLITWVLFAIKRERRDFVRLVTFLAIAGTIQIVKSDCRIEFRQQRTASTFGRAEMVFNIWRKKFLGEPVAIAAEKKSRIDEVFLGATTRLSDNTLERVVALTPSKIPYWHGDSFQSLATLFSWDWYHTEANRWENYHKFGHVYEYLRPDDGETFITYHAWAEGYMNFGLPGVAVVTLLLALMMAGIEKFIFSASNRPHLALYCLFACPFLLAPDLISLISALWILGVSCGLALFFFRKLAR